MDYIASIVGSLGGIASLVAVVVGIRALKDAHGFRLDAARDRDRQHLERIADLIERMNVTAWLDMKREPPSNDWRQSGVLLDRYIATTVVGLPACRELSKLAAQNGSALSAALLIVTARVELLVELIKLTTLDTIASTPKAPLRQRIGQGTVWTDTLLVLSR